LSVTSRELGLDDIRLPGVFVDQVLLKSELFPQEARDGRVLLMTQATAQASIGGRSRDGIAQRLAADLRDGYVVNLGVGIPLLIPQYIPADVEVILHAENGCWADGRTVCRGLPPRRVTPRVHD
jgi:acyl CoA:acetate/3-ketoacid CoA transferase